METLPRWPPESALESTSNITNILIPQWRITIMNYFNDIFVEFPVKLRQKLSAMGISADLPTTCTEVKNLVNSSTHVGSHSLCV